MDPLFRGIFKGRTALVTGHTGFKGGWLSVWLDALGAKVVGYSLPPPTEPSFFEVVGLRARLDHREGDVLDAEGLRRVVDETGPEFVFHLAAQPLVRRSYREPRLTFETNVMGTVNLLEAVRRAACVRACVVVTSDKCYENREWPHAYREIDPMGGHDPYSSSKGCAELAAASYRRSFFHGTDRGAAQVATVRAGNVFGGGDWAEDRIVPDCVRALAAGRPVVVRNPDSVRPWQHVLEPLSGYLRLASLMHGRGTDLGGPWNFGPVNRDCVPVGRLVDLFLSRWGSGSWTVPGDRAAEGGAAPHEAGFLALDWAKANRLLGWHPVWTLEEGLRKAAAWYSSWLGKGSGDMRALTLAQIEEYAAAAREARAPWTSEGVAP